MPTHVAFLRAINLGATRKFPKDAVVAAAESAGFTDVACHLNTGNVRVVTPWRSRERVEAALEAAFLADRGFAVPTVVLSPAEVRQVVADGDEIDAGVEHLGRHYVSLLKHEPDARSVAEAEAASNDAEHVLVRGRAVHLVLAERDGYHRARLSGAWVEKRLGVATNRTLDVLRTVAQKWCGPV